MNRKRDVVITGMGVVSPIGVGAEAFWESLIAGKSGVGPLSVPGAEALPVHIGAEVKDFDGKLYVKPRKSLKVMCPEIQWGYSSTIMAMEQAGLSANDYEPERCGVVFGAEMYYCPIDDVEAAFRGCRVNGHFDYDRWATEGMSNLYPLWMLKYLPNMPACHIAIGLTAHGPNNTIATGEVSSLLALIEAANVIERGQADVMVTGGSGTRLSLTPNLNRGGIDLSPRNEEPEKASRPFDADRDGMVNGQGAAAFILESAEHAAARGAAVLARVAGYGRGFDPQTVVNAISANDQNSVGASSRFGPAVVSPGLRRAIDTALRNAEINAEELSHVNAHGVSTVAGDRLEAKTLIEAVGDVPVTALKSFFGNLGGGGGAVEMMGSMLALEKGQIPFTLNYESPDPQCSLNIVHGKPLASSESAVLLINRSGTGQSAAVVVTK